MRFEQRLSCMKLCLGNFFFFLVANCLNTYNTEKIVTSYNPFHSFPAFTSVLVGHQTQEESAFFFLRLYCCCWRIEQVLSDFSHLLHPINLFHISCYMLLLLWVLKSPKNETWVCDCSVPNIEENKRTQLEYVIILFCSQILFR